MAPSHVTTQDDLDMDESSVQMLEQMEMVPIGKIEEVAKQELRSQRRYNNNHASSIGRREGASFH